MRLALTDQQESLRDELRDYFAEMLELPGLRDELARSEGGGPIAMQAIKQMATDGWLGVGWPTEYGGHGRGPVDQYIFYDEAQRAGAPVPFLTINTVGPTIQDFGSPEQKQEFLPRILAGDVFFSIGYTEPSAGTDLGALTTRAVREGDELVINGQKIFTSLVDHADYVWLATRTTPDIGKHKGMSMVIVPTNAEGFSYTPIDTVGEARTYCTYYEDVRVPVSSVVGGEAGLDRGWTMIVTQLNRERVSLCSAGLLEGKYLDTRRWAQQTLLPDGRRVIDQEWVRIHLARVHAKLDALRLLNYKVAWGVSQNIMNVHDSSATKVFGTEFFCEAYALLLEIVGSAGILKRDQPGAALKGVLERAYRGTLILTFGGGTNEVQRDLIAAFGLKMPRPLR
ncbi:MAG: alkylation response protein AidB-like acyl-CoA dehydrogenase [Glaciecola sp.]|jgi:alkylation response protein AidB-like acyl-CoA dehydrogenase